jgi:hypothetical protein
VNGNRVSIYDPLRMFTIIITHTATSILSLPTNSRLRMTFFSIFTSCESFLARSGPKAPAVDLRKAWPTLSPPVSRFVSHLLVSLYRWDLFPPGLSRQTDWNERQAIEGQRGYASACNDQRRSTARKKNPSEKSSERQEWTHRSFLFKRSDRSW